MKSLVILALVAVSVAQCVDVKGFGAPNDNVDPKTRDVTPKILAKAKELGKTNKVEIVTMSENTSTRWNLYKVTLNVDGKTCHMTVSAEEPTPKFLEQPDKNNCILCC